MGLPEIRRLPLLEEQNCKVKRALTDLTLDKLMLQDLLSKKG